MRYTRPHLVFSGARDDAAPAIVWPGDGLVGRWDFDNVINTQYVEDLSGNGRHLQMGQTGIADPNEPDVATGGRLFRNDYCMLDATVLSRSAITVLILACPAVPSAEYTLLHMGLSAGNDGNAHLLLGLSTYKPRTSIMQTNNSWMPRVSSLAPSPWLGWHLYGLKGEVVSGSFGATVYLDSASETFTQANVKPFNVGPLTFCAIGGGTLPRFTGYVKAAVLYDRVLSAAEMSLLQSNMARAYPQCSGFAGDARIADALSVAAQVEAITWS